MRKIRYTYETGCVGVVLKDGKDNIVYSAPGLEEISSKICELQLAFPNIKYIEVVWDEEAHYE